MKLVEFFLNLAMYCILFIITSVVVIAFVTAYLALGIAIFTWIGGMLL